LPREWRQLARTSTSAPCERTSPIRSACRYLSRYTHRVAIANSRLIALDRKGVTFKWKDYRAKGRERAKVMTLVVDEFIRRFLTHVLPRGFHRIRHSTACLPVASAPTPSRELASYSVCRRPRPKPPVPTPLTATSR
jgi:hypothetical protein